MKTRIKPLKKSMRWIVFVVLSVATMQLTMMASFADQGLREEASTLEQIYQDKAKAVLNNLMNPEDYTLVVHATLRADEQKLKEYQDAVNRRFLPGLNIADPLNVAADHNLLHELKQKVEIQVILADNIPQDRESLVKDILKAKLHLNEETGDTISIARAQPSPVSAVPGLEADKLSELTPKMIAFWIGIALLLVAAAAFWFFRRRERKHLEEDAEAPRPALELGADVEEESKEEEVIDKPKTPEELERERDALEMALAFAKGELVKLVKDYPSIVCRAAEEFFAQGKIHETAMFLESLGWETSRKLFKDLDTRMWARIGASLRERERDPTLQEIYDAVHVFQRFALSFVLERAGRDTENPFAFLFHLDDSQRIDLLANEDPFNIGLIAIYSSGAQMGEILSGLTQEKQNDVLLAITKIKHLPELHVKESVDALLMRLERIKADPFIHAEGPTLAADFMRSLEPLREEELYQSLLQHHPSEAEKLRQVRVMFSDIPYYPTEMVRRVIEGFESEEIMKALVGYQPDFIESVLSLLPTKRALMIQNDLFHMTEFPPNSQCAEFRRKITNKLEIEFEKQRFSISEYWKSFESNEPSITETVKVAPEAASEPVFSDGPPAEKTTILTPEQQADSLPSGVTPLNDGGEDEIATFKDDEDEAA